MMTLETSAFIFHFGRDEYSNLYRIPGVLSPTLRSNINFVPSFPKLCGPVWNFLVWATCQATIKLFLWIKGSEGDVLKSCFNKVNLICSIWTVCTFLLQVTKVKDMYLQNSGVIIQCTTIPRNTKQCVTMWYNMIYNMIEYNTMS